MHYFILVLSALLPVAIFFRLVAVTSASNVGIEHIWIQDFSNKNLPFFDAPSLPNFRAKAYISKEALLTYNMHGQVLHKRLLDEDHFISLGECCYVNTSKLEGFSQFFTIRGEKLFTLQRSGIGLVSPDGSQIIMISTDGSTISLFDKTGKELLSDYAVDSLITDLAFSDYNNVLALGSSNGLIVVINHLGKPIFSKRLTDHRYPVIKSIAISYSSEWVGVITGLEPEKLVVYQRVANAGQQKSAYKTAWSKNTGVERRTKTLLHIDGNSGWIYEEDQNGFKRHQLTNKEEVSEYTIPFAPTYTQQYALITFAKPTEPSQKVGHLGYASVGTRGGQGGKGFSYFSLLNQEDLSPVWSTTFDEKLIKIELLSKDNYLYGLFHFASGIHYMRLSNAGLQTGDRKE